MANAFRVRETIDRPIETVWDFLSDLSKIPLWMTGIENAQLVSAGTPEEGARVAMMARGKKLVSTIDRFEPPHVIAFSSQQQGVFAVYTYTCEADGDHTHITLHAECFPEKWIWKLLHPIIGFLMKTADGSHLKALKHAIETTGR